MKKWNEGESVLVFTGILSDTENYSTCVCVFDTDTRAAFSILIREMTANTNHEHSKRNRQSFFLVQVRANGLCNG